MPVEGAVTRTAPLWITAFSLLAIARAVGTGHWHGGPLILAAIAGLIAAIFLINVAYHQGRISLMQEAADIIHQTTEAYTEALAERTPSPTTFRATGGGPMDGTELPNPINVMFAASQHGRARVEVHDVEDGLIGYYVQSADNPEVLEWIPADEEVDQ